MKHIIKFVKNGKVNRVEVAGMTRGSIEFHIIKTFKVNRSDILSIQAVHPPVGLVRLSL